ncbi:MAG TPA: universal stress protein [Candidatus Binataceae bacterium]|nr:universal stress protein [Candidatus Binataceae bacterium]
MPGPTRLRVEPGDPPARARVLRMTDYQRPEPESFLDLSQRSSRGRLKVYVGAAAGVGKTYKMLEEAHELRRKGIDVVLGFIETHHRTETEEKVGGLEVIPRHRVGHRGVSFEEMDLEAILARKPEVAVVDELAHTNVPGSSHEKRYQDVEVLLDHGIDVITAMNIQHVESLNPAMRRISGVEIRETVPDLFLARADQIVNVDVTVEALRERLRDGKIYPREQIDIALKNFFNSSNLSSLREMALREVARGLSRQRESREAVRRDGGRRLPVSEKLMVGLSSNPGDAGNLIRRACRIATQLNADWYAVHVETPSESVKKIRTRDFVTLLDNINLASDLGAETVWLKGDNIVETILDFARDKGVTTIVLGRTHQPFWKRVLGRDVPQQLIQRAHEFDLQIVGDQIKDSAQ